MEALKEKTRIMIRATVVFYKTHLSEIVFIIIIYSLLRSFGRLPYVNLIGSYQFYIVGVIWIHILVLFRRFLPSVYVARFALGSIVISIPFTLAEIESASIFFGFLAFIFLITFIAMRIYTERSDITNEIVK